MKETLLAVQYISIAAVFIESWIVVRKWNKPAHTYLFMSCVAMLINNFGYLLEMTSKSKDAFVAGLKISYLGRVWFGLFLLLFVSEFTRNRIPSVVKNILVVIHGVTYIIIFLIENNTLYYRKMQFATGGLFPKLTHEKGVVYIIFMTLQVIYILVAILFLIRSLRKAKKGIGKKRLRVVLISVIVQALFFLGQIIGLGDITYEYDITMLGYAIGTMITLFAIVRYDLLGTTEIARDFVIDRLAEGILATDVDGIVQYYNEPLMEMFPNITEQPNDVLDVIKKKMELNDCIVRGDRFYDIEKNSLTYREEKVGTIYSLVDKTDDFRYMAELREQKAIADRANRAKSSFLANMSHEIRTPINAVLGMDEMILRESRETQTKKYAADILSAGKTLLSLINDILDLSKVEEGKMEIIPVQYDLSSMINDLVNMVRNRAEKKGLKLEIDVDSETPNLLIGDEIRVRQCALNLLTNAVKYTESGTVTLQISFEKTDDKSILLKVKITDTGIGIKEEDMEKLFTKFTRLEENRNHTIEGTGLGMSITVQLLELMGSALRVEREYGKGSEFSFAVEQEVCDWDGIGDYSDRYTDGSIEVYHELFHAPSARILVVDDTEINLSVIENLLKQTQIQIDTATSGPETLTKAAETDYDVIFIDHMMPGMDGIETLRALKKSDRNASVPAVALTANAVSGARERYLEAGFTTYMSKPVDGEKLEKLLYNLLPDDKIKEATPTDAGTSTDEATAIPNWLYDIPEIDVEQGVKNGGSPDGYLSILTVFYRTAGAKADELEQLYTDNNIKDYTIKVHALKSSARIIGATALSDLARQLEDAGNQGNEAFLSAHTGELLTQYRSLAHSLCPLQPEEKTKTPLGDERLREAYQTIIEIAGSMDFDLMDELLNDLGNYQLPEDDEKRIQTIRAMCLEMNWDDIRAQAEEALSKE